MFTLIVARSPHCDFKGTEMANPPFSCVYPTEVQQCWIYIAPVGIKPVL